MFFRCSTVMRVLFFHVFRLILPIIYFFAEHTLSRRWRSRREQVLHTAAARQGCFLNRHNPVCEGPWPEGPRFQHSGRAGLPQRQYGHLCEDHIPSGAGGGGGRSQRRWELRTKLAIKLKWMKMVSKFLKNSPTHSVRWWVLSTYPSVFRGLGSWFLNQNPLQKIPPSASLSPVLYYFSFKFFQGTRFWQ